MNVRRAALPMLILFACATGHLPASYAVILDPSLGSLSSGVQAAILERLPKAEFMQSVLPADKHEAIVLVRGECKDPCVSMRPTTYAYEIYRDDKIVRRGRIGPVAPKRLASRIARELAKI